MLSEALTLAVYEHGFSALLKREVDLDLQNRPSALSSTENGFKLRKRVTVCHFCVASSVTTAWISSALGKKRVCMAIHAFYCFITWQGAGEGYPLQLHAIHRQFLGAAGHDIRTEFTASSAIPFQYLSIAELGYY